MRRRRPPTLTEVAAVRALDLHKPLPSLRGDEKRQRGYGAAVDNGPESDSIPGPAAPESPFAPGSARPVSQTDYPDPKDGR